MISPELADFIDSGVAILGASRGPDLAPEAFRGWGAAVAPDGRVRVLISSDAGKTLDNLRDNGRLAVTFTDIRDFRSIQVKGSIDGHVDPPGPDDVELLRRYHERFIDQLAGVGHPPALGERIRPFAVFAVWLRPEELYDQTPGRTAGTIIGASTVFEAGR